MLSLIEKIAKRKAQRDVQYREKIEIERRRKAVVMTRKLIEDICVYRNWLTRTFEDD